MDRKVERRSSAPTIPPSQLPKNERAIEAHAQRGYDINGSVDTLQVLLGRARERTWRGRLAALRDAVAARLPSAGPRLLSERSARVVGVMHQTFTQLAEAEELEVSVLGIAPPRPTAIAITDKLQAARAKAEAEVACLRAQAEDRQAMKPLGQRIAAVVQAQVAGSAGVERWRLATGRTEESLVQAIVADVRRELDAKWRDDASASVDQRAISQKKLKAVARAVIRKHLPDQASPSPRRPRAPRQAWAAPAGAGAAGAGAGRGALDID